MAARGVNPGVGDVVHETYPVSERIWVEATLL